MVLRFAKQIQCRLTATPVQSVCNFDFAEAALCKIWSVAQFITCADIITPHALVISSRRNYWSADFLFDKHTKHSQPRNRQTNQPLGHTNNWRRGQIWQNAKKMNKQSNKEEARLTERLTLQNLCAAFRHHGARRRGKGDEPGRLEFWNKNNFYFTYYLFWLKEIAVVMVSQGACISEKFMVSIWNWFRFWSRYSNNRWWWTKWTKIIWILIKIPQCNGRWRWNVDFAKTIVAGVASKQMKF